MKKVILIVYFGNLPNYFNLFLDSCKHNEDFDFIIFTDQDVEHRADNLRIVRMSFDELNRLVLEKLGDGYRVFSPYKLCDYKVAYGKIFEDFITNYSIWGYCDTDMLLGRISNFISDELFMTYDRLLIKGHLTFYKNSKETNNYYQLTSPRYIGFNEAAKIKEPCFVDEISMPGIMKEKGIDIYEACIFADVLPQSLSMYVHEEGAVKNHNNQKFYYINGRVCQEYFDNGRVHSQELAYIHLQKRAMNYDVQKISLDRKIFINPNIFTNNETEINRNDHIMYKLMYYYTQLKKVNLNRIIIKMKIFTGVKGRA